MFQNEVLKELITKYREGRLAHAYLIETNNLESAIKDLKELLKIINCPHEFSESCSKCNLCNLINKDSLPSIKIIEPEGASIKKNQIEELKIDFGTIPIYSRYNCYIIKNAEKLNSSSANSMLKFVEEPTPGIIGFFLTTNKDVMMDTIKSRCQSLNLKYESKNLIEKLNISEEELKNYKELIKEYLPKVDNQQFINNKKEIISKYPERKDIENIMKLIFELYFNQYQRLLNKTTNEELDKIYELPNDIKIIAKKLGIITNILHEISYNVNIELILDKFVIEMRGNHG